ncbi:MAG: hypothetical protein CXT67_09690 [Methanobacteriota archaeon]|nr:MAG: hypothetical protein CXT67_09690 [Euryarchaeota archaeon]
MERKGFIGGSDAVKIMRGDWQELWEVKTGRKEPDDLSQVLPVQLGILTEDFNLRWFEKQHDMKVGGQQAAYSKNVGGVPLKGTIDGFVEGTNALVEAKHTNAMTTMDKQIEQYMPQLQFYMNLAQADGCYLSAIFGNSKWESAYVDYSSNYFSVMLNLIKDFWSYVERDISPATYDIPAVNTDQIPVNNMTKRDVSKDNEFISLAHDYINTKDAAKLNAVYKKSLKDMVGPYEREIYSPILTIKRNKRGALLMKENANE